MHRKLSYSQRQQIEQLLGEGQSQSAIARVIGVHRSTVKRELERNNQDGVYNAFNAHCIGVARKVLTGKLVAIKRRWVKNQQYIRICRWLARSSNHYTPPAKRDFRDRRYRTYYPARRKKDLRREWEHPHLMRSISYEASKSFWEQNYRLRDHKREGFRRRLRTAKDWRNYRYQKRRGIFDMVFGRNWQISQNKQWRERYERRRKKRWMDEQEALIAQNKLKQQLREEQPANEDRLLLKEQLLTLYPPVTFFILLPLRRERRSPEVLWALPPPAG